MVCGLLEAFLGVFSFFLGNISCQACMPSIHHATLKLLLCWGIVPAQLPATNISSVDKLGQGFAEWFCPFWSEIGFSTSGVRCLCFTAFPPLWPGKEWGTEPCQRFLNISCNSCSEGEKLPPAPNKCTFNSPTALKWRVRLKQATQVEWTTVD